MNVVIWLPVFISIHRPGKWIEAGVAHRTHQAAGRLQAARTVAIGSVIHVFTLGEIVKTIVTRQIRVASRC